MRFLEAANARDPENALTYQLMGDAYALRGDLDSQKKGDVAASQAKLGYANAARSYLTSLTIDPNSQPSIRGAVLMLARMDSCDLAEDIRETHERQFGKTAEQATLASIIEDNCQN